MKFNIRGENLEVTDSIREYVERKISKLERYFDTPPTSEVHVNLSVYNDEQTIEVTIPMTNLLLRGEVQHVDLYAAIDLVVDKLERQIRKYKTKVNRKFRQEGSPKHVFAELEREANNVAVEEESDEIDIVRTKRFDLKPMDSEEAVLQMDMLGHSFYVFTNAITNETNVVYRRKDGKYGLIEPNA
ncbi:ribosome hibernation-promoting factor, HPF/YfiA family [Virgibacillus halodenitrificans]|jgi:putative sigma-54 modulation protein|uniref:Ribosome hibernation promoting factor n=1 Tax=Virgibacillus halodenitrificans TaxID=1482 RepID=A0AAC9NLM2_VIRHA|nr:ribosome-associated translation inhibitor RaiA [Virgibacillus halodenitrificans]APC49133.1 ribosomal subunit interface protein [Virgibacillus halodenitrificans]MBD1223215.1 ribosome-associated translation inhibitor RaiA [Virgibacillus halodenitrificans]MCG1026852.1 ribosome-associated translation inhibitor RaiA [Virgibacillus halodenitrificans]MCJ0933001.1 ribosome-associated translation inhibitor RaiA [Virgibacillus halodenitrificans]MEC2160525.1 ribosome-associated translation inhibitor R